MLLLGTPSLQIVRVYHRRGARWVQRGRILEGESHSNYGAIMALDVPRGTIFSRRFGLLPVTIALGYQTRAKTSFRVFHWAPTASTWISVGADNDVCTSDCQLDALSIEREGSSVTVAASHSNGTVQVYQISMSGTSTGPWAKAGPELSNVSASALTSNRMQLVVVQHKSIGESLQLETVDTSSGISSPAFVFESEISSVLLMQVSKSGDLVSVVVDLGEESFGIMALEEEGTVLRSNILEKSL